MSESDTTSVQVPIAAQSPLQPSIAADSASRNAEQLHADSMSESCVASSIANDLSAKEYAKKHWSTEDGVRRKDSLEDDSNTENEAVGGGGSSSKCGTEPGVEEPALDDGVDKALLDEKCAEIGAALGMNAEGYIKAGVIFLEAKAAYRATYKELVKLVKERLDISPSYIARLSAIAANSVIRRHTSKLPSSPTALYYATQIDENILEQHIESGAINRETTIAQIKDLAGITPRAAATEKAHKDLVVTFSDEVDRTQVLKAAQAFAQANNGTLDYRKNEALLGTVWMKTIGQKAKEKIAESVRQLPEIITINELRALDAGAAEELLKEKARLAAQVKRREGEPKAKSPEPRLPDDYPGIDDLRARTGLSEITLKCFKTWCVKNGIPTRLALTEVTQPVYVWEQLRLIAERPDERKVARKRLEQLAKAKSRSIKRLAFDVLDMLDNMTSMELKKGRLF
jgi:predicted nucleic-acid-binding protein